MELEEEDDMRDEFDKAAEWMRTNGTIKVSTDQKLRLYGFFKQVSLLCWINRLHDQMMMLY